MSLFSLFALYIFSVGFHVGERLTFDVSYGFIHLGKLNMQVSGEDTLRGHRVYIIRMDAKSEGAGALFTVADTIYSFVDADSLYTLKYEKKLLEGKFRDSLIIDYFSDSGVAHYSKGTRKEKLFYGAIDPLGLYYYIRAIKFKSKDTIRFPYHVDRRNKIARIYVEGIKSCKMIKKNTKCYVLKPDLKGGIIKGGGKAVIYVTADGDRLPVYMKSKLYFGSLKVKLKSYHKGLVKKDTLNHFVAPENNEKNTHPQ